jgi:hypothetical protein
MDHITFIRQVADAAVNRLNDEDRAKMKFQLVYGAGQSGLRGVTYYGQWNAGDDAEKIPLVEVCAFGEVDAVQLAGTTIHELAHVLAGFKAAHGKEWHDACQRLGLRKCRAAGNVYMLASFDPDIRAKIATMQSPVDGKPVGASFSGLSGLALITAIKAMKTKPCPSAIGSKGGKSRGKGSGSRLRLYECECEKPVKVRVSSDAFEAHCDCCRGPFRLVK